jgi:hypothetical protein
MTATIGCRNLKTSLKEVRRCRELMKLKENINK